MKTIYGNLIGIVCESLGDCDGRKVMEIVGLDPRIGRSHLIPGLPYGGPCLVKDVVAFANFAKKIADIEFFNEIHRYNELVRSRIVNIIEKELVRKGVVAVMGLAYRDDSCEVKDSQSIKLIEDLISRGFKVIAFDICDKAMEDAKTILGNKIEDAGKPVSSRVDAVVIMSGNPKYIDILHEILEDRAKERCVLLVDVAGLIERETDILKQRARLIKLYRSQSKAQPG